MMIAQSIAAEDVRTGDYIFNSATFRKQDPWTQVVSTRKIPATCHLEGGRHTTIVGIEIQTTSWTTVKYSQEVVVVRREGEG